MNYRKIIRPKKWNKKDAAGGFIYIPGIQIDNFSPFPVKRYNDIPV